VARAGAADGYKKAAIIVAINITGAYAANVFTRAFLKHVGKIVDIEHVPDTTVDWQTVISRAHKFDPDVLFTNTAGRGAGNLLEAIGSFDLKFPIYGGSSTAAGDLIALGAPPNVVKRLNVEGMSATIRADVYGDALARKLKSAGVTIQLPLFQYASVAAAFTLFAWAGNATKSVAASKISRYLETQRKTKVRAITTAETTGSSATRHQLFASTGSQTVVPVGPLVDGQHVLARSLAASCARKVFCQYALPLSVR
jgi:ABC-type branched-subunit amino acid transport system substrate-binding protein